MATFSRRVGNVNFAVADPRVSKNLSDIARDKQRVNKLIEENEAQRRAALEEQRGVQQTRLGELTELLASEEERKFTQAIPEIAESAQARGFLETSGFGEALGRQRVGLAGETAFRLSEQALSDRDLEVQALGDIGREGTATRTGGVQREFSQSDRLREEQLARELAIIGRPSDPGGVKGPSLFQGALGGAAIGSRFGAGGAAIGAIGGAAGAGAGTYLCTNLKNLDLMTEKEVKAVHKRIFPELHKRPVDWLMYNLLAPLFIKFNKDYDWKSLKPKLCDAVLSCKSNEEAFEVYKATVMKLFLNVSEGEKVYG